VDNGNDNLENSGLNDVLTTHHSLNDGSFDDIQNIIDNADSGDTIILNGNFVAKDASSMISINKKLTITSSDGASLDGNGKSRIFFINSSAKGIVINNIIFKNAYTVENGGAIYLNSDGVVIDNCTFQNCNAKSGGAISSPTKESDGIKNIVIKNSKFYNNHASSYAGAIFYISKNLEITSCVFDSNYVELHEKMGAGGALQIGFEKQDNNCKITDCIFNNNYVVPYNDSNGHAGAACIRRGVNFINCNFTNNSAYDNGVLGFHDGGSVINCKFYNNRAMACAGVIRFYTTNQSITIENSYFKNNTAKHGGVIYFNAEGSMKNCIFENNSATYGGVIYSNFKQNIDNSTFKSNYALSDGGVIYSINSLFIQNSYFIDNYAKNNGGAIYNLGTLNSKNTQYQINKAKSLLNINAKSYVNCSDDAIIYVTFVGGNNIINAIWSKDLVTLDDNLINPINNISSQKITLNVEGKIFNSITDNNGKATFKFNTINFQVKNYQCVASFESSDDYFGSSKEFNLSITTKTVYKTPLSNIKKIKKVKKYQVYKPTTKKN